MDYKNSEMRIDEIAGYFRDEKISLVPPFQRGRVWSPKLRRKLMENIIRGRPIPAIFLYKQEAGSRFSYNILDGKQRLETLLLFIADGRADLSIGNWRAYLFESHEQANFKINVAAEGERRARLNSFAELDEKLVRDFREYRIPTIEIDLDAEDASFAEIISLFIDINSYGVKVNRFDIVRTMKEDNKLLSDTFKMIAVKHKKKKDYLFKTTNTDYADILKRLQVVQSQATRQQKVDKVWERFLEIVLFVRTGQHRTLAQTLKAFLGAKMDSSQLTTAERSAIRQLFKTMKSVFAQSGMKTSQLALNQTHFYTMATAIHAADLVNKYGLDELKRKLKELAPMIERERTVDPPAGKARTLKEYMDLSSQKTTHPGRRADRQDKFVQLLDAI